MELNNLNPISEKLLIKSKNYLFPIKVEGKSGTCFFINTFISIYLCVNYSLITDKFIESEGEIKIGDKIIKLDKNRQIISFGRLCKFISIDKRKEKDNIPDEYILDLEIKLSPYNYINKDVYLLAYHIQDNSDEGKGGYLVGKILNIDGYEIYHQLNTKNILSVAPICLFNNNKFEIIGIQLENPEGYKYMSYGYLLKYILEQTNIKYKMEVDKRDKEFNYLKNNNDLFTNLFIAKFDEYKNYSFYTFQEYKENIINFHIDISKYYKNQTFPDFNNMYNIINIHDYKDYLEDLYLFKNINYNKKFIFNSVRIVNNLNKILLSNNINKINQFSYFISGFIYVLNTYSKEERCQYKNDKNLLYMRKKLSLEDLIKLDKISLEPKEENRIITFKTFLENVTSLETYIGIIDSYVIDFKNFFSFFDLDKYDTKIYIIHHFSKGWETSCFSFSITNYKIFNLFTFFKVNEVKINFEDKNAEIRLEHVGKYDIFEDKFAEKEYKHINYNIKYDQKLNAIMIYE